MELVYDYSIFIYPDKIEMTPYDCDIWISKTLSNLRYESKYNNYVLDRVIYWRLNQSKCVTIERDHEWFKNSIPKISQVWDQILFFRKNSDKLDILVDYINSMEKKKNKEIMEIIQTLCSYNDPNYKIKINEIMAMIKERKNKKEKEKSNDDDFLDSFCLT